MDPSNEPFAGLASASPLEVRELGPDRAQLLVCVFGRNVAAKTQVRGDVWMGVLVQGCLGVIDGFFLKIYKQEKRSFLTASAAERAALSVALERAVAFKQS